MVNGLLEIGGDPILQQWFLAKELLKGSLLTPHLVEILEPVETIEGVAHHLPDLETLPRVRQFQHAQLGPDDLLFFHHGSSLP